MAKRKDSQKSDADENEKITVPISKADEIYPHLERLAKDEIRSITGQVKVLVREALTARGILKAEHA